MRRTETALSSALAKASGFSQAQMRLFGPALDFIKAGGTEEGWLAVYRAVASRSLSGEGHGASVEDDRSRAADARHPPAAGNGGHAMGANNGPRENATVARSPSPTQLSAAREARQSSARSVFDRITTVTGRAWGNVQYCELDGIGNDGELALELRRQIGAIAGKDRLKRIRDLLTPQQFYAACRRAGIETN